VGRLLRAPLERGLLAAWAAAVVPSAWLRLPLGVLRVLPAGSAAAVEAAVAAALPVSATCAASTARRR